MAATVIGSADGLRNQSVTSPQRVDLACQLFIDDDSALRPSNEAGCHRIWTCCWQPIEGGGLAVLVLSRCCRWPLVVCP